MDIAMKEILNECYESLPSLPKIPAGWTLLGFRPRFIPYLLLLLCFNPEKHFQPYVIWTYNRTTGGCSNGHYYQKIEDAERHFLNSPEFS